MLDCTQKIQHAADVFNLDIQALKKSPESTLYLDTLGALCSTDGMFLLDVPRTLSSTAGALYLSTWCIQQQSNGLKSLEVPISPVVFLSSCQLVILDNLELFLLHKNGRARPDQKLGASMEAVFH